MTFAVPAETWTLLEFAPRLLTGLSILFAVVGVLSFLAGSSSRSGEPRALSSHPTIVRLRRIGFLLLLAGLFLLKNGSGMACRSMLWVAGPILLVTCKRTLQSQVSRERK